jgi:hypothetical protein
LCDLRVYSSFRQGIRFQKSKSHNKKIYSATFAAQSNNYIYAREHSAVVIWDVRTQKFPIKSFEVSENLTGQFAESLAEDEFYDQFHIAISPSGKKILTGNYLSDFHILDVN